MTVASGMMEILRLVLGGEHLDCPATQGGDVKVLRTQRLRLDFCVVTLIWYWNLAGLFQAMAFGALDAFEHLFARHFSSHS